MMDKYIEESGAVQQLEDLRTIKMNEAGIVNKLKDYDPDEKDDEMVKKASIMGEILNRISDDIQEAQLKKLDGFKVEHISDNSEMSLSLFESVSMEKKPISGKIHREELSKMFYLNNQDPYTYNLAFFSEYFSIDIAKLRTLVNSMGYPVVDRKKGTVELIYRFYIID